MSDSIIVATTQDHLDIETIQDDLVILKTGICSMVIQTSAINFGLLSEEEQEKVQAARVIAVHYNYFVYA